MTWQFGNSAEEFAESTRLLLDGDPERHTLAVTIVEDVRGGFRWSDADPHFGWWADRGRVRAAVLMTPPYPLLLIAVPQSAIAGLVEGLRERAAPVTAVNGERESAAAFAVGWTSGTSLATTVALEQRLYRLERLIEPRRRASGAGRLAVDSDVDLVTRWLDAFHTETGAHELMKPEQLREMARRRVTGQLVWVWEDDAEPVAMAGRTPTVSGVARVGPVYTPVTSRRRGYGTAVTAACTQHASATGARGVVLFTDRSNPTSNAIYQEIGYRPVADRTVLRFA